MPRVFACLVAVLFVASPSSAQTVTSAPGAAPPGVSQQAAPPRDSAVKTGTAILRGRVFAADTSQPLRKAQVRLTATAAPGGTNGPQGRITTTDADGRYEFKELPAGRYTLNANKGRYVGLSYGQRRPYEPGRPLEILEGQTVEKVDFSLPRGAIITGHVLDELGDPAEDVSVTVMRSLVVAGRRRLVNAGRNSMTNDNGEFRLFGLAPGTYYVSATLRAGIAPNVESDDHSGYAPTYYPSTASAGEAQRLTIGVGQTLNDIDVTLVSARVARINGTAVDSQGRSLAGAMVIVTQRNSGTLGGIMNFAAIFRPDVGFSASGLPPGDYTLMANIQARPGEVPESATTQITLAGRDVDGVQLVGVKPSTLTGRIVLTDPSAAQTLQTDRLRLAAPPKNPDEGPNAGGSGRVNDDLTFEIKTPPGLRLVTTASATPGWTTKAVRANGIDVTETGIEVRPSEDLSGIEIELTNRLTNLSGVVTNGRFKIAGLPPGDYYVIAVDSIEPGDASDPEYLDRVMNRATRFSLGDAETKTLDLQLATGL